LGEALGKLLGRYASRMLWLGRFSIGPIDSADDRPAFASGYPALIRSCEGMVGMDSCMDIWIEESI
jgi:hypothetical protein